jgi:hypothetical protein
MLGAVTSSPRISGWINWYRFARETFDYAHDEAVVYANLRHVEETNRAALKALRAS